MGNHRYQIGFSGDTKISWKSLDYQPYFTSTASNVGYGYWSHDIGGHMIMDNDTLNAKDAELFTRWLQYATFSPIFRTHSTKDTRIKKEMWIYPLKYRNCMFDAINIRYSLAPYIYTMARKAYDSGISICHPLYYEYPDNQQAYDFKNEYFFGDDMIVIPVTSPEKENFASVKVWLPDGEWYEWFTGTSLKGGNTYERKFLLNEIPVFVRSGAIIPMCPKINNLQENIEKLVVRLFPGNSYETRLYEDNGDNKEYIDKGFAYTKIKSEKSIDGSLKITIFPREGSFTGMNDGRSYEIQLFGMLPPEKVTFNGLDFDYSYESKDSTWNYSGKDLMTHIYIPKSSCNSKIEVLIKFNAISVQKTAILDGLIDKINRLNYCVSLIKENGRVPGMLSDANNLDLKLGYDPADCVSAIESFNKNYPELQQVVLNAKMKEEVRKKALDYLK
jgi:hypothetical protein